MRRTCAGLTALSILAVAGCDDDGTAPELCTDDTTIVDVQISGGTSPTVSWSPACPVALFLVEGDEEGDTWSMNTDEDTWGTPSQANRIEPPVTYGVVPAGIDDTYGPLPLIAGRRYEVILWRIPPTGNFDGCIQVFGQACMIGLGDFTP
ncbi:MAG TPA: hypothetical protein VK858_19260 [Longimicrobiales bacterium]|nr:hypothetical protein [Longimicrobiales bacterium]